MVKFKDFSRPLSVNSFQGNFFFKDFQDSPVYSSTFQACANPVGNFSCFVVVFLKVQNAVNTSNCNRQMSRGQKSFNIALVLHDE